MTGKRSESDDEVRRSRPSTEESYGIPGHGDGLLSWEFVSETMASDRSYWVTTIRPDGTPHARPTWGVWVDGAFHCGGGERTRWVRNLSQNGDIVVHREDADEVVIIEGTAERIDADTEDPELVERLEAAYEEKYDVRHGTPFFRVRLGAVFAWSDFPADATRWAFGETDG
ncbi:pyridoxamine 5'-phosphate oxidase family protein [Natronococcus wangiae]|uniref:pyridoxamine 5'-phosphate oxidase family protein n=1 Tax=Natronococcus wangiae TaxID=3068275 RepID=UPI00273D86D1|nr:pyridoxamine 5'-phosphate oxidase family protein [Natronococcus sp. AD5]